MGPTAFRKHTLRQNFTTQPGRPPRPLMLPNIAELLERHRRERLQVSGKEPGNRKD